MLYRLPETLKDHPDVMLHMGDTPVAKIKLMHSTSKKNGFMTDHTFVFVLKGEKMMYFGNNTVKATEGQLLILKRGIYVTSEVVLADQPFEALVLFLTDDFVKRFLLAHQLHVTEPPASKELMVVPTNELLDDFKIQFTGFFHQPIQRLDAILQLKQQELLLLLLAGECKEQILAFLQNIAFGKPDIEFIVRTHLLQPVTLEELAKLSHRSLASFKRDFQQHFQCAPKKWINDQRLEHARTLLLHSGMQVTEIAMECGFENTSHFIRIFKEKYGATPQLSRVGIAVN
ncbi:helix-turn-helix domain-containing protein [Pseudoflavitalea sp. G-6-1-2]|uniref:helix-turn-helix domain-containing protein n=1 Tax=Pseudoflavitalea sp. G-6-1-2 TaxID=2728841 RepID=UPI00146B91FF|nr:helix-turn-helix domain-containing protein [Pseudoflavitalea sp. G-6-1-2]NML21783.1 helix-turn-helix domain-containing protein [Pseudoflavitalea sp. G-6-1-2]